MRCRLQAVGLLTAAAVFGPCQAITSAGRFDVLVALHAPDGCLFSTQAGANASSQFLTVTCPSNLFVNVQPTIIASPASPAGPDVGAALAMTFGTVSQGGEVRGPSELSSSVLTQASTGTLTDARTALNGAIFIERRTGPGNASSAGIQTSVQLSSDVTAPQANTPTDQLVEMWLTF